MPTLTAGSVLVTTGLCLAAASALAFYPWIVAVFTIPKLLVLAGGVLLCAAGAALPAPEDGARPCPHRQGGRTLRESGLTGPGRAPLDLPIIACLGALALSTAFSDDKLRSILGMYNYYAYGVWPLGLCAGLYLFASRVDEDVREAVLRVLLVAAALAGGVGLLEFAGMGLPGGIRAALTGGRAVSTFGSPVSFGGFEAMALPLALSWSLRPSRRDRMFGMVCLSLIVAGLLVCASRAAWLGAVCGALACLGLSTTFRLPSSKAGRAGLAVAALALGSLFVVRIAGRMKEAREVDTSRVEVWRIAWKTFQQAPWLGTGPDTFELGFRRNKTEDYIKVGSTVEYQAHAHNDILQVLATTGLAGAAAYAWFLWALVLVGVRALRDPEGRSRAAALSSGLLALFVNLKFNPMPLEVLACGALFCGFLAAPGRSSADRPVRGIAAPWTVLLLLFGAISALAAVRLAVADRWVKKSEWEMKERPESALRLIERGLSLQPCELSYHMTAINFLSVLAGRTTEPDARARLLDRGSSIGRTSVACHPNSPLSHFCLGAAELMQARAGRTERFASAEAELDRAIELDPNFVPILSMRLQAAMLRGDIALRDKLIKRLGYLHALPHRNVPARR